ncbi:rRNA-processing protein UTP23 homolog [Ischnura elegans]|uniref:rRNA-processing protein UTP23 homolog n=1 Tax=Ischnura elegans TaxID=197161 RepID=UPI001ED89CA9|nr:rRNA-processing protein UTP23 homolog [Ischnura elegans]
MKVKRQKKVHRFLSFFCNNYGFRQPYQILVDGTICLAALTNKVTLKDVIPKYFDGSVKLLTTQCVIIETEKLGHAVYGAMLIVKQFPIHQCGHADKPLIGSACLASMIKGKNPNRYIIATQDRELQSLVRKIPGVPLLYLHQRVPTLEHPSPASVDHVKNKNENRFGMTSYQEEVLNNLKKSVFGETAEKPRKRKKKGGPNPLSCLKKKRKVETTITAPSVQEPKKKRKRVKNKSVNAEFTVTDN